MAKLGDICFQITDGSHNPPAGIENSKHLMLSSKNINDDEITTTAPRFLTDEQFDIENKRTNVRSGDLLMTIVGTVGRVAVVPEMLAGICLQRSVAVIKPNPTIINNRYLMYQLQSMRKFLESEARGVAQKGIYLKQVGDLSVITPPLDEQYRVVDTLDHISGLIHIYQQQLTKLDELIKARFVEMFGDKNYHYESLINLILDGTSLSYGIVQPGNDGTGDMGVLRPVDIVDGKLTMSSIKYIDRSIGEGFKKTELDGDELLITVRGTTGITALTDGRFAGMNVTRGIAVIRYNRKKINPLYLNAYFNTDESQRYIQEHTRGATLQQINLSDLRIQRIMLPPLSLQNQFAAFVAEVDKSKVEVQKALDQTQLLFDSLMQQYFG